MRPLAWRVVGADSASCWQGGSYERFPQGMPGVWPGDFDWPCRIRERGMGFPLFRMQHPADEEERTGGNLSRWLQSMVPGQRDLRVGFLGDLGERCGAPRVHRCLVGSRCQSARCYSGRSRQAKVAAA